MTKSKLEFDLTRYRDFTLNFPGYQTQDDYSYQLLNPGMFTVTMAPEETIEGELIFMPTEVKGLIDQYYWSFFNRKMLIIKIRGNH